MDCLTDTACKHQALFLCISKSYGSLRTPYKHQYVFWLLKVRKDLQIFIYFGNFSVVMAMLSKVIPLQNLLYSATQKRS